MPKLYTAGLRRIYFTHARFWLWMAEAFVLATLIVLVPIASLGRDGLSLATPPAGDPSVETLSFTMMTLVCLTVGHSTVSMVY